MNTRFRILFDIYASLPVLDNRYIQIRVPRFDMCIFREPRMYSYFHECSGYNTYCRIIVLEKQSSLLITQD